MIACLTVFEGYPLMIQKRITHFKEPSDLDILFLQADRPQWKFSIACASI